MLSEITHSIVQIDQQDVIERAQDHDLSVNSLEDFRDQADNYQKIEEVMDDYRSSHARFSALGGLTTGIGGFTTALTFSGLDTMSLSYQLYRLSQRFAILNGFDGDDPLQKDKMMNIYFEALGINAVVQATLKHQLLGANAMAGSADVSENIFLRVIAKVAGLFGRNITSEKAGRWLPIAGGIVGAGANYSFALSTSKSMKRAYRRAYFSTWHDEK